MADRGALIIADISGYTKFVGGVELEHGAAIVADLLSVAVEQLSGVAKLAKLEGDAAFCVATSVPDADAAMTALYGCYDAFRRHLRDAQHLTTCTCDACSQMSSLDLKVVVHVGEYVTQRVAGSTEVAGSDVILVHRLLKNSVAKRGYALVTDAAARAVDLPLERWGYLAQREEVDDVGAVDVHVLDLAELWAAEQERSAVVVPEEGSKVLTYELPGPVPVVWDWMSDPQKRRSWNGADSIDAVDSDGPSGVGTVNHCVHGRAKINEEIVDWKPYNYCTFRNHAPFGTFLFMVNVAPNHDAGTTVQFRMRPEGGGFNSFKFGAAYRLLMKKDMDKGMARLRELITAEERRAAGPAATSPMR